jgi:O-antigen ligase
MNIIENIALKRRVEVSLTGINIASYTAAAIFLPYILSTIILLFLAIYIVVNKQTRQMIFVSRGSGVLKLFLAYALILPLLYRNWIGLAAGIGVVLAIVIGLYLRAIMTGELFEKLLHLVCCFSLSSAGYAIIEKITKTIDSGYNHQRIAAVFFHPNYFGTIVGTVIIICAYKVLTRQNHTWFYYMVAAINVVSMYLCKSMFVWVEVFIGVAVLLVVFKRHRLLALWLFAAAFAGMLVFICGVDIIPRLYDVEVTVRLRQQIWEQTIQAISQAPLLGHGLYSFIYLFDTSYHNQIIPHAHSIYLDLLLNFGIIGTGLFLCYTARFYKTVFTVCFREKNKMITSLILAVTAAALVHGTTDITLLWVQTLPLFLLILSGFGSFEPKGIYLTAKAKYTN